MWDLVTFDCYVFLPFGSAAETSHVCADVGSRVLTATLLARFQIHELQNNVLIGGRRIDTEAKMEEGSDEMDGAVDGARVSELQMALAAEQRRAEKLEARVRALTIKVGELTSELEASQKEVAHWKGVAESNPADIGPKALRELSRNTNNGSLLLILSHLVIHRE